MRRPPLEYQASLMVRSASPEYVGSEHIKWMLEQPKMYTVRDVARGRVLSWGRGGEAPRPLLPPVYPPLTRSPSPRLDIRCVAS